MGNEWFKRCRDARHSKHNGLEWLQPTNFGTKCGETTSIPNIG